MCLLTQSISQQHVVGILRLKDESTRELMQRRSPHKVPDIQTTQRVIHNGVGKQKHGLYTQSSEEFVLIRRTELTEFFRQLPTSSNPLKGFEPVSVNKNIHNRAAC